MPPSQPRKTRSAHPQPPRRTRQEHSQETAQDYVELIADLIGSTGEARVIDLARRLGVTHVTVGRTIQRLKREGLVTTQPYRSIFLTDSGRKLSEEARSRHEIVVAFLESIGVPAETARSDAEGIEHHVSDATLKIFMRHLGSRAEARAKSRPPRENR
jgi:DtxR family manganese transport transcriptional regulator